MPTLPTGQPGEDALGTFTLGGDVAQPDARLTAEFAEVAIRDALVADAAQITQIGAEVAQWHADNNPDNAVRLTMQTVEILYLEPSSSYPFNDCGHFTGVREWEARLYDHQDPDTGNRKAYGPDGYDLSSVIHQCNFEIQERGGYGGGSLEFLAGWEDVDLEGTERIDVWLWDEPAYRGYLRVFQRDLGSPEYARPQFYGMVAILDKWLIRKKYAYGCDTDVGQIFRDICEDFVAIAGRFPNISIDANTSIGATLKEFDGRGKSIAQAFNELCDLAPNQAIWGVEMDTARPVPGDTIYFRAKSTETAYVVVVGDNVRAFTYPVDTHELVNSLKITGGPVKQPNVAVNGSFEELKPASEDNGNYLTDADFEAGGSAWTGTGGSGSGPTIKQSGGAGAFGAGRSGQYWAELDTMGEEFYQFAYIIPEREYTASCWCRLEDGTSNSGVMILEGYNASNVLLTTTSVALLPSGTTYERFSVSQDLAAYPTVVKFKVRLYGNGGTANNDGILIDDVGLYEECGKAQEAWEVVPGGAATITDVDWDHTAVTPRTGAYCIKVDAANIATGSDYVDIYTRRPLSPSIDANERYTLIVWWHTNGAGTPGANAFTLGANTLNSSNGNLTNNQQAVTIPSPAASAWRMAKLEFTSDSAAVRVQTYLRVQTNEAIYFDDVMLVKGEVPEEVSTYGGYWSSDVYEREIDVEDTTYYSSTETFDDLLDAGVADSIDDYGDRMADVSNELVTDRPTALAFAAGQFNAKALPKVEGRLDIFGARFLIGQEGKVRLVNLPDPPDPLWPARASYTIGPESIDISVELGNQRPDLANLLNLMAGKARSGSS